MMKFQSSRWAAAALCSALTLGCASDRDESYHYTPVTERGACATVIMPGQTVPMGAKPGCPGGYSSLGGAVVDDRREVKQSSEAIPGTDLVKAPLGAAAYPVLKAEEALRKAQGKESSSSNSRGSSRSSSSGSPTAPTATAQTQPVQGNTRAPVDPQAAWERAQLEALERQIAQQSGGAPRSAAPTPPPVGAAPRPAPVRTARLSIADELAALQQRTRPVASEVIPEPALEIPGSARAESLGVADRVTDRDGDARPDHWEYQENGKRIRELFDENGDGRPDRTVLYDPESGLESHIEEDRNLDGRLDSWIDYRGGQLARQRRDTDYDGSPDNWSFYRAGQLARQEIDLNGDGFRNRIAFFDAGRLVREREDLDGDGRTDRVTHYDELERVAKRDEDRDSDGKIDTRSFYEAGKLVRREMVSDELTPIEPEELGSDEWSAGAPREDG